MKQYTKKELGTWIDGSYGEIHALEKMIDMLSEIPESKSLIDEIVTALEEENDDTYNELLDDATDLLNKYTEEDLVWIWEAGNLILTEEEEE